MTTAIREDRDFPNYSKTSVYRMLKDLNFVFSKRKRNSKLIEREDIIAWRHRYLRSIKKYRLQNRKIYYLDETWVNAGYTTEKVWQDKEVQEQPRHTTWQQGLTTGLKDPSGKGGRWIILHAGSSSGFVDNGLLIFQSKKSGDYHEEMNSDCFQTWFAEQLLPNIEPHSVIVIDNAPYHSKKIYKVPTTATKKADIQQWLKGKNIAYEDDLLKAELLQIVRTHKHLYGDYVVDQMARQAGHTVLRLPTYHCELNPIKLVWAQVKQYVARNNRDFNIKTVKRLFEEGLSAVTAEQWEKDEMHVKTVEEQFWKVDGLMEDLTERIIINLNDSSSSDSETESESDSESSDSDEDKGNFNIAGVSYLP